MKLHEKIESVHSKDHLVDFIVDLKADLKTNKADWENPNLEQYLDAMKAWLDSIENVYRNTGRELPSQPSWKTFAEILHAAKIYE